MLNQNHEENVCRKQCKPMVHLQSADRRVFITLPTHYHLPTTIRRVKKTRTTAVFISILLLWSAPPKWISLMEILANLRQLQYLSHRCLFILRLLWLKCMAQRMDVWFSWVFSMSLVSFNVFWVLINSCGKKGKQKRLFCSSDWLFFFFF